jgi:hypothetical protein
VSEKSISSSFNASTRNQSVRNCLEVADFFIFRRLSYRNDSDDFIGLRVRDHHHPIPEQSQCDKSLFAIIQTLIKNGNGLALKDLFDPNEINSVFPNIGLAFRLTPLKSYMRIVATNCSYFNDAPDSSERPEARLMPRSTVSVPLCLRGSAGLILHLLMSVVSK